MPQKPCRRDPQAAKHMCSKSTLDLSALRLVVSSVLVAAFHLLFNIFFVIPIFFTFNFSFYAPNSYLRAHIIACARLSLCTGLAVCFHFFFNFLTITAAHIGMFKSMYVGVCRQERVASCLPAIILLTSKAKFKCAQCDQFLCFIYIYLVGWFCFCCKFWIFRVELQNWNSLVSLISITKCENYLQLRFLS